jgi:hypothetical protein
MFARALAPIAAVVGLALHACTNPFAPALAERDGSGAILGDQRTVDGFFQNFRFAYVFRDTLTYGRLLDRSFAFVYRNFDRSVDVTWGRDEDMMATLGLFNAAQQLDLVWNDIIAADGDSLSYSVARGFTLTITFSPTDVIRANGRVNMRLERPASTEPWKVVRWRDESNFF